MNEARGARHNRKNALPASCVTDEPAREPVSELPFQVGSAVCRESVRRGSMSVASSKKPAPLLKKRAGSGVARLVCWWRGPNQETAPWPPEARPSAFLPTATLPIFALAILCLVLFASGCSTRSQDSQKKVPGAAISKTALSTVGTKYRYGGNSPSKGFDCSGLVCWAYSKNGLNVPRTAKEQSKVGDSVSKSKLQPGDLVVFKIQSGLHTGIYTGKGKFVHSPSSGKRVRVDTVDSKYWRGKFIAGRRHGNVY